MVKNNLYLCKNYIDEINSFAQSNDLSFFQNKTVCISGATGLIMSFFIDVLLSSNINCKIIALVRDKSKALCRFSRFADNKNLVFVEQNLLDEINVNDSVDFVIHAASNSDQKNYATYPIETMHTNYMGINNLLKFAVNKNVKRFLFTSSSEVYGDVVGEIEETNNGNVNCLSLRSCYNESKRASETLGICYAEKYNIDFIIARISRVYGPTMKLQDSKALSQFMMNSLNGENVKIKSSGTQKLSYVYVADAVSAIILLLKYGENKNAYNIANNYDSLTLKEIAQIVADFSNVKVKFIEMTQVEKKSYSEVKNAVLSSKKIEKLGWNPKINLKDGIFHTMNILKELC